MGDFADDIELLIFDMDGVITSEEIYWYDAGLTIYEVVEERMGFKRDSFRVGGFDFLVKKSEEYLTRDVIMEVKNRGLTSNWDLAYVISCLYVIGALRLRVCKGRYIERGGDFVDFLSSFSEGVTFEELRKEGRALIKLFLERTKEKRGEEVIDYLNVFLEDLTGVRGNFERGDRLWRMCQRIFQEWHLGDELYERNYGVPPNRKGKEGLIYHEDTLLPMDEVKRTLKMLKERGISLGIATGRPYEEAVEFLRIKGLLDFFDKERIVTYREVEEAERVLLERGIRAKLSKPHPYPFLRAIYPDKDVLELYNCDNLNLKGVAIITDATGDVLAAKEIGSVAIGVLSGIETEGALRAAGCDVIIKDMTHLPTLFKFHR
ncbi:MAG: HAD family hydrolase [Candidatus Methanospirareceae archaeon]